MDPIEVLRELFQDDVANDPGEAGHRAVEAVHRLDSLGFAIVGRSGGQRYAAAGEDDYPMTHARVWG